MVEAVEYFPRLFKETKHLAHKREIQHKVQLMSNAPLPNVRMYHFSPSWEVISFRGADQYWGKSVFHFSCNASPFHVLNSFKASSQWRGKQLKACETSKSKMVTVPLDLQQIEFDSSKYAISIVLF